MPSLIIDELSRSLSHTYPICQPNICSCARSPARSRIAVAERELHGHRIQIRRVQRREVKLLDLDYHIKSVDLHDPFGANGHRTKSVRIQPAQIVLRVLRRLLLRHENVAVDAVMQILERYTPGRNLVVALRPMRRDRQLVTILAPGILDPLPVGRILRSELGFEGFVGDARRTLPKALRIDYWRSST